MKDCRKCKHSRMCDDDYDCNRFKENVSGKIWAMWRGIEFVQLSCSDARRGPCQPAAIGYEPGFWAKLCGLCGEKP